MHYFDYAASTPLHPKAAALYSKISQEGYGNTTSLHEVGTAAQNIATYCRQQFANRLGVNPAGIYFTGGGTESNLLSIISLAKAHQHKGKHIVTSLGEHPSVDAALAFLEEDGFTVTKIPFMQNGIVNIDQLHDAITDETVLMSIQHSNPEIGTIQPIEKIAQLAKKHDILLHSDCVQSFGKVDLKNITQYVDSLTISGHKLYGPKGIGIAYINPRHRFVPVFPGLIHEDGFRGGTLNVPAIAALAEAITETDEARHEHYNACRHAFLSKLATNPSAFSIYEADDAAQQIPQIIGLGVSNIEGQLMMLELNRHGFAISTGSACQVGQLTSSKVMIALQVERQKAKEFIRISFGKSTTLENVYALAERILQIQKEQQGTTASLPHLC